MCSQIINYSKCKTCKTPLGIHSINNESCKMIPGYSVLFGKNHGYHLLKKCCPLNSSEKLSQIFDFIGEFGNYNKHTSKNREININCCPVCLETFNENNENEFYYIELPCQHIICSNCLFNIKDKCPICKQNIKSNINPHEVDRSYTNPVTVIRTSSIECLKRTTTDCSTYVSDDNSTSNSFYLLHKFDQLRFSFWNKQDPSKAIINTVSTNTLLDSISPLLVNVITDKTHTYNDVVCYIYINNILDGFVKYDNQEYINNDLDLKLSHSGDKTKYEIENSIKYNVLYHNILINGPYKFKILTLDNPCNNSIELNSTRNNKQQQIEFDIMFEQSKILLNQENLIGTLIISQLTYKTNFTLRELSPNKIPATAFLTTNSDNVKNINMCEWVNDDCGMNTWAIIGMYN